MERQGREKTPPMLLNEVSRLCMSVVHKAHEDNRSGSQHSARIILARLAKQDGLTQAELAEKMNYSDKAVSRWEHGDTLPDVNVLCELCDFYGITLNDLISEECEAEEDNKSKREIRSYRLWRCILSGAIVWLIATGIFACDYTPE